MGVYQKVGANHVDGTDHTPSVLTETAIRYAKAFNYKFAFKFNGSYMSGTDWISNTRMNQNSKDLVTTNPKFTELNADAANPSADLWNRYGDESNNRSTVTINYKGKTQGFNVARTGYFERDLVPPSVRNIKFDAGLFYRLTDKLELSYTYRYGLMDGIFQRGNKVRLGFTAPKDVSVHRKEVWLELRTQQREELGKQVTP